MIRLPLPVSALAGLEVWRIDFDPDGPLSEEDWAVLDPDERRRAERFVRQGDRVRAVATRAALRRRLGAWLGRPPDALEIAVGGHGKPWLPCGGVEFNASHAGCHALIALSRVGAVGVDIERCDATLDVAGLAEDVLSPPERAAFDGSLRAFFAHWVAKEAAFKALGVGIGEAMRRMTLSPSGAEPACCLLHHPRAGWVGLRAWTLGAPPGYAAALVWRTPQLRLAGPGRWRGSHGQWSCE
jgi:4'-phosphopantetheinyl transferase